MTLFSHHLMSIWCKFLVKVLTTSYLMSNYWCQCFDVKLMSYLMSNCWCQFDVNFRSRFWQFFEKIFFKVNVFMWNWRHIWCQTIDVNVLMLNWHHIWCQTVDVNLMSILGQGFDNFLTKPFSRSMSLCEIDVIFDVKLLMSMFWC
jgi:hypothetical protein